MPHAGGLSHSDKALDLRELELDWSNQGDLKFIVMKALWVLHENLNFHRDIRATNIIAEPVQNTTGSSRSKGSRYVLSGFEHAIKW